MESDVPVHRSRVVLKTVNRMPRTFLSQIYAVDAAVTCWVSLGSLSYAACAFYLSKQDGDRSCANGMGEQVASVEWTFQVQTVAFGAVLLLNLLNLGMRQHLLPFKCNLLLLYINGVAFMTDLLLWRGDTIVRLSSSGRAFAPLRYVQWCHSTPTMIYMLALLADCGGWQLAIPLLSDVAMVVSGLAACYLRGLLKDAMTVVSFGTFVVVLYYLHGIFHKTLSGDVSPEQRSTLRTVLALLLALWSAFPVVWLAADWHLMGPQAEAVCWGVCDYLAKVVFSSQLWQSNLAEVQLRQDRALEAWEASNRVEAVARLMALLKQRDDLLSTLSHELRTPLAGIVALSETLCQEVSAALPASAQNLATVRATATCMLNIVTSTLDSFASRRGMEQGTCVQHLCEEDPDSVVPSVPLSPLDLRSLVETVTTVLRPLAHDGVMIVSDLPSNLPPVAADATRLNQVFYNLVGNAMRFTTHGEVRIAARVVLPEGLDTAQGQAGDNFDPSAVATNSTVAGGGGRIWRYTRRRLSQSSSSSCSSVISFPVGTMVEVSVEDTGIGIEQELLDELFLPYRTGQTVQAGYAAAESPSPDHVVNGRASKSIGGTGLGLYLVRLALRAQGSDITADSAPGIGSVFRFRLQISQQHQANQQSSQPNYTPHANATAYLPQPHTHSKTVQQQQHPRISDESPACQKLLGQSQPHADDESDPQVQISVSACESGDVRCSSNASSATAASEASGGGYIPAAPSSPKPTIPLSPKLWVASATGRRVKRSSAATVSCAGRAAGSAGGVAGGVSSSVETAIDGMSASQRPSTGALPMQGAPGPVRGRMSLDEQPRRNLHLPPPLPPSTAGMAPGGQCRPQCTAGCCASELSCSDPASAIYTSGKQDAVMTGIIASAASDGVPSADAAARIASGLAVLTPAVRVLTPALTPAPTPTAATSRVLTAAVNALTPFDVAHAIEEGRALARAGLRPNFRHRNNGILQVLSVDDDPINQLVAGQMLTSQSWKVVKCMNGPEALAHLQLIPKPGTVAAAAASPTGSAQLVFAAASSLATAAAAQPLFLPGVLPDCILLDVMMPGMSGFEVCRKLRQHFSYAQLPIIIVSAKGDSAAVEEAFESGADDYMTKPYKRTEMVARIRAQIRIRDSVLDAAPSSAVTAVMTPSTPQVEPASAPSQAIVATGSVPVVTEGSTPRACVATTIKGLLDCCSAASDQPSPSPVHASSQPQPLCSARPTSVDVLLLQQPTPDSIKMRMEASRGGLESSWGKVGLYKRENMLGRTAVVGDGMTAPWDASTRVLPTAAPVTGPAAVLVSPPTDLHPVVDAGLAAPAGTLVSEESLDNLQGRVNASSNGPLERADAVDVTVRPVANMLKATVVVAADNLIPTTGPSAIAPVTSSDRLPGIAMDTTSEGAAAGIAMTLTATEAVSEAPDPLAEPSHAAKASAGIGGNLAVGEPGVASALLQEVLMEVRRSRAVDADVEKLTTRVAALRTACCSLAAERDGWRRQARDLRALLAASFSGAAVAAAAGVAVPSGQANLQTKTNSSTPPQLMTSDALAAAHGSRSSGDSLSVVNGGGCTLQGMVQNGAVAAQLEDLKKEAALLRQQLSVALASVGGNLSIPLGVTDTGGSRPFGLLSAGAPGRLQRALLQLPRTSDSPHLAAMGRGCAGDGERSAGVGDAAQGWGLGYGPPPDIFLTTETSGLSAGSGPGAGTCDACTSGEGATPRVKCSGVAAASRQLSSICMAHANDIGPEANTGLAKKSRRAFARNNPTSRSASAMSAPAERSALGAEKGEAAKQAASVRSNEAEISVLDDYCPAPLTASAGPTATQSTVAQTTNSIAAAPRLLSLSKADAPQGLGELPGSSTASNGGCWTMASTSMEEEMSQPSSAGRAHMLPGSAFRSSRSKPGSGASTGPGGILRMLCIKGAAPATSPHVSPPRRNSHQYQQQ